MQRLLILCLLGLAMTTGAPAQTGRIPATFLKDKLPADVPADLQQAMGDLVSYDHVKMRAATETLQKMGPKTQTALPALCALLDDQVLGQYAGRVIRPMGKAAVPALVESLKTLHDGGRNQVTVILLEMKDPELAPVFRTLLKDKSGQVRGGALYALEQCGETIVAQAADDIAPLLDDDGYFSLPKDIGGANGEVSNEAAKALALAGPASVMALRTAAFEKHSTNAMKALIAAKDPELLARALKEIRSEEMEQRCMAVITLGNFKDESAFQALAGAASDPDMNVRYNALISLGQQGDPRAYDKLMAAASGADQMLAGGGIRGLGTLRDRRATDFILKTLKNATDMQTTSSCAIALGELGDERAVPLLVENVKNDWRRGYASSQALESLAKIGTPAVPALVELLTKDARGTAKTYVIIALGKTKDYRAVPAIVDSMKTYGEAYTPAQALLGINSLDAVEPLVALYESMNRDDVRRNHIEAALGGLTSRRGDSPQMSWREWWEHNKERLLKEAPPRPDLPPLPKFVDTPPADQPKPVETPDLHRPASNNQPQALAPADLPPAVVQLIKTDFPDETIRRATARKAGPMTLYRIILQSRRDFDRIMTVLLDSKGQVISSTVELLMEELPQVVADSVKNNAAGGAVQTTTVVSGMTTHAGQVATRTITYMAAGKKLQPPTVKFVAQLVRDKDRGTLGIDGAGKVLHGPEYKAPRAAAPVARPPAPANDVPQQ